MAHRRARQITRSEIGRRRARVVAVGERAACGAHAPAHVVRTPMFEDGIGTVIQILGGRGPPGRARTCPVPGARLRAGRVVMRAKRRGPRPPPRFPVPGQTSVADAPTRGEAFTPTFQKKSTAMKVQ